jgi:murein DD-endopeptidase MepM/ murein hydrolase activator NlpD
MPSRPLRVIAITVGIGVIAAVGAVSLAGSTRAGAVTVRRGDTLWALARRYHVGLDQLAGANGMRLQDILPIGRVLEIPGRTPVPSVPATSATTAPATAAGAKAAAAPVYTAAQLAQMKSFCVSYHRPAVVSIPLPSGLQQHPERLALRPLFVKWSAAYGVPAALIEAIAWQESGWQNNVTSSANAQGIGQLLPTTAALVSGNLLGLNLDVTVASDNIQMMARFFAYLLTAAHGDQCVAVASYYQGFGAFQHFGVLPQSQLYVRSVFTLRSRFS